MAGKPITVSQLNHYINRVLVTDSLLVDVLVTGEVSGTKIHTSGHTYFTLKDKTSKINCFFSSYIAQKSQILPQDGMEMWVRGQISVYEAGGYYSIHVKELIGAGEGDLAVAFQQLKEKLEKEGLFSVAHKIKLPVFPVEIAVITSETGAAIQDILSILTSRNPGLTIRVFPSLVQGEQAPVQLIRQLKRVQELFPNTDVIILGRGGGSLEDLWAFNNEDLARAIYNCSIPIISAVGHETDFTITDFVADVRAETPTAAAVMAVPNIKEWKDRLLYLGRELQKEMVNRIQQKSLELKGYQWEHLYRILVQRMEDEHKGIEKTMQSMGRDLDNQFIQYQMKVDELYEKMDLTKRWSLHSMKCQHIHLQLRERMETTLRDKRRSLATLWNTMEDLDPFQIMERGYGILLNSEGKSVNSVMTLQTGEAVSFILKDGNAEAEIKSIKEKNHG